VPEYNARQFTADGFYRSGDLMRLHASGNYIVEGRKKDLINRGGEKISAEEVENLILMHPAVTNVACVPMPDAARRKDVRLRDIESAADAVAGSAGRVPDVARNRQVQAAGAARSVRRISAVDIRQGLQERPCRERRERARRGLKTINDNQ
jgi:acyl-CoA synthetase (AMP-forming)/AMP-acid ligase II